MGKTRVPLIAILALLVFFVVAASLSVFSKELGLANTARIKCLFRTACDLPLSELYQSRRWDELCYETYRPITEQQRYEYNCEFCRIVTLMSRGKQVYTEREEYVMERRVAQSAIVLPEHRREGSGAECFEKNSTKIHVTKSGRFNILTQDIFFLDSIKK